MELIIGKTAGFCFGVKNAVDKTYETIKKQNKELYCLGELVHNEKVIENITSAGVVTIDDINNVPENTNLIIRAHGVKPEVYDIANKKNIHIIDLTCPKVLKVHELAKNFCNKNYYIILIAEKSHPETIGTSGFCGENISIVQSVDDIDVEIKKFKKSNLSKIAIIAQTTFSTERFEDIVKRIREKVDCEVEIENTICNATAMRQAETEELSKKVDLMIVVGGKNSANTKRLYDISCINCDNAILIQNKNDELLEKTLRNKYDKIGLMAGASTPRESIEEVVDYINKIGGENEYSK